MKQSPTVLVLLVLVVLACIVVAGMYGALPQPIQSQLSGLSSVFGPRQASKPYLEKFEGSWQLTLSDGTGNAGTDCVGGTQTVKVHDGAFATTIAPAGHTARTLSVVIAPDGTLSGTMSYNVGEQGSLSGSVAGAAGQGSWQDDNACRGTVTLQKTDPVVDPVVGKIANYTGQTTLTRGGQQEKVFPDVPLYAGDQVSVTGGDATLSFGVYPPKVVTVSDGQTYTVPNNI